MDVIDAIKGRLSTRAFLDQPVSRETVTSLLECASWSPSGGNIQPWQVAVVMGECKQKISEAIITARNAGTKEQPDFSYYPTEWYEPYKSRRIACGIALFKALGVTRDDREGRETSWNDNYHFFGAPVGLLFFLERKMGQGAWVDLGLFLQSFMLAAHASGLATCAQASIADYPKQVRDVLGLDESQILVCGMSLGYPDTQSAVNNYRTERAPVDEFTTWHD